LAALVQRYAPAWNPENLFRLCVISRSNSAEDQALKLQGRDDVLAGLRPQRTVARSR